MPTDQHDEALFNGFESLTPTVAASQSAVERTRDLLLQWEPCHTLTTGRSAPGGTPPRREALFHSINAKPPSWQRSLTYGGLAACLVLTACLGVHYLARQGRVNPVALTDASKPNEDLRHPDRVAELRSEAAIVEKETKVPAKPSKQLAGNAPSDSVGNADPISHPQNADVSGAGGFPSPRRYDQYEVPIIHAQVADFAPVIIANGGKDPIRLGSATHAGGGSLHVWDWSRGNQSRVLPEIEFRGNERVALSADGRQLVWASGKILDLGAANWTKIDLGGEDVKMGEHIYARIGAMRFSPDGSNLALLVTNFVKNEPGHIESDVVQVVEFPSGRRMCEFPAGEQYALRIGFSSNGKQIVSADSMRQISRRDSATGTILKSYAPAMKSQVMGVAISPDGKYVAAMEREPGDLYIWDADTGRLLHCIDGGELRKLGGTYPAYGAIRFSPDGAFLAAAYLGRLFIFDAATGKTVAALKEDIGTNIQWSTDGKKLTVVTPVTVGDSRKNTYPAVHEWDWRSNKQIELTFPAEK